MTGCASVRIEVAPGELLDKLSILEIKLERIEDAAKRANVLAEHAMLAAIRDADVPSNETVEGLAAALKAVNLKLWDIEDALRAHERDQRFDAAFVSLARSVYRENDERARLKRAINLALGARFLEEKSYGAG